MSDSSRKVALAALAGNSAIAVTKFVAAWLSGSSAMLSEAIHSVVDTGNQILMLYGLRRANRPSDRQYPFGHAREIYFWSFVVAILIFAGGAGLSLYEGTQHLVAPGEVGDAMINYAVLGVAALFEGASWWYGMRKFAEAKGRWSYLEAIHRGKDPDLFVVVFEDSAALLGLLVAFLGVLLTELTGSHYFDGIASVLIGLILGATAIWLAYETKSLLIGESAVPQVIEGIRALAQRCPGVLHVNDVLTMQLGPNSILANLSVDFDDSIPAGEVESTIRRLTEHVKRDYPSVERVFVELGSCGERGGE